MKNAAFFRAVKLESAEGFLRGEKKIQRNVLSLQLKAIWKSKSKSTYLHYDFGYLYLSTFILSELCCSPSAPHSSRQARLTWKYQKLKFLCLFSSPSQMSALWSLDLSSPKPQMLYLSCSGSPVVFFSDCAKFFDSLTKICLKPVNVNRL